MATRANLTPKQIQRIAALMNIRSLQMSSRQALWLMEQQLTRTPYLAGEDYSLADISLSAYTHVVEEGGFNLREFPQICAWLARIEAQPGHQTMAQCLAAAS